MSHQLCYKLKSYIRIFKGLHEATCICISTLYLSQMVFVLFIIYLLQFLLEVFDELFKGHIFAIFLKASVALWTKLCLGFELIF